MHEVELTRRPIGALSSVLPDVQATALEAAVQRAAQALDGRVVWHVSSTATGGGVAEMLHSLLGYFLDAGVRTRWLVIDADERFFAVTKRLHNAIHGVPGEFTDADHVHYQEILARNTLAVSPRDVVMLHDPQTAGLVGQLRASGVRVAWRSHIGRDTPNGASTSGWEFLRRYIADADAFVFSRPEYVPPWADLEKLAIIPPSIDPLSAKNRPLPDPAAILAGAGLPTAPRLVAQVSRWDRLKDMPGVMRGFEAAGPPPDVHLVLAGPAVDGVTDDPEGAEVFAQCQAIRADLPADIRSRVHLASIPMADIERNATIVNALQRQAAIIVQKSLAEGFGLTVAEGMWKGKPVIASAVGGIQDQIIAERTGLLLSDPADPAEFAAALRRLLSDDDLARRLGEAARARVLTRYLDDRQLIQIASLVESLAVLGEPAAEPPAAEAPAAEPPTALAPVTPSNP
jgi:trehalose synthase